VLTLITPFIFTFKTFNKQISVGYSPLRVSGEIDYDNNIVSMELSINSTYALSKKTVTSPFYSSSFPHHMQHQKPFSS